MTVIAAIISKHGVVHATDSLITRLMPDGSRQAIEWERTKLVPVRHWRGAMAYWGLSIFETYGWSTLNWLTERAAEAPSFHTSEDFAIDIVRRLNLELSGMTFPRPLDAGLGIHFTVHEWITGYWVPELFLISNYANPRYTELNLDGVRVSRETYHTVANTPPLPEHREPKYRLEVHQYLQSTGILRFSNGDPGLFNLASDAILASVEALAQRGMLHDPDSPETWLQAARRPVEVVSEIQHDFCSPGLRIVGGRVHDLMVRPAGQYSSTSGDAP